MSDPPFSINVSRSQMPILKAGTTMSTTKHVGPHDDCNDPHLHEHVLEPPTDYSYLDDPAEREWLTNVKPMDVLKNAHRIYDFMADAGLPAESMIREEAFRKASHALIIGYDVFYEAWLNEMPVGPAAIRRAKNVTA